MKCVLCHFRPTLAVLLLLILSSAAVGKDSPGIVMFWPSQDKPSIKVTFGTFRQVIMSVPAGATLKVDRQDRGATPALVNLIVGTHVLELSKDGFAPATSPVDIKPDEMEGGSITIELGGLSQDLIELRDGTVLTGDAISLSLTDVVFRVEDKDTEYDRNQVKRIMLVERVIGKQPAVVQPVAGEGK
jgi:hypothetical protein